MGDAHKLLSGIVHAVFATVVSLFYFVGDDNYDRVRRFFYSTVDAILLCFSMDSPNTLVEISDRWMPQLREHCPNSMVTSHILNVAVIVAVYFMPIICIKLCKLNYKFPFKGLRPLQRHNLTST